MFFCMQHQPAFTLKVQVLAVNKGTACRLEGHLRNCSLSSFSNRRWIHSKLCQKHKGRKKRSEHVTPMLISLHWLPIKQRIEYKLATLAFRYFDGTLPPYLSHCLSSYTPHRSLRSSSDKLLCVPRVNLKSAGARSFQYQAPCVWNSVPIQTRLSPSLTSFKSSLKTHLFRNAFTWVSEIVTLGMGWWRGGGGGGGRCKAWD